MRAHACISMCRCLYCEFLSGSLCSNVPTCPCMRPRAFTYVGICQYSYLWLYLWLCLDCLAVFRSTKLAGHRHRAHSTST